MTFMQTKRSNTGGRGVKLETFVILVCSYDDVEEGLCLSAALSYTCTHTHAHTQK